MIKKFLKFNEGYLGEFQESEETYKVYELL